MSSAMAGGGSRTSVAKYWIVNQSSTDDLQSGSVNLANSMDDSPAGPFYPSITPSASTDDNTYLFRFLGWDTQPVPQPLSSDVNGQGAVKVSSGDSFSRVVAVESRDATTGVFKPVTSNCTIANGPITTGILMAGCYSITSEVRTALSASLDDASTTADAATVPAGIVLSKPRTLATALTLANNGVLPKGGGAQPGWSVWVVDEMRKPSQDLQVIIQVNGATF